MRTLVRSDLLPALLSFVEKSAEAASFLRISRFRLVIDANPVVRDLYWIHKTRRDLGARSDLRELLASGLVIPYAPPDLDRDVRDQFPRLCADHGIPVDGLEQSWRDYKSIIKIVSPRDARAKSLRPLAAKDYEDLPYAQLALQIGAAGIVTSDRHFQGTGIVICAPDTIKVLRTHARAAATELTISLGAGGTMVASGFVAFKALTVTSQALRRMPLALQLALIGVALASALSPDLRRRVAHVARSCGEATSEFVAPLLAQVGESWREAQSARVQHPVAHLSNRRPLTLVDHAVIACAEASSPLSLAEIAARAPKTGYTSDSDRAYQSTYLRRALSTDGRFERTLDRRWKLANALETYT